MDQGGTQGIRDVPARSPVDLFGGLDDRCRGWKGGFAKPMHDLGSGVFELALPFRGDAFRLIYAVQLAEEIWVIHAVQKKSTQGIKTPKREIDLTKDRLKRLKEMLR
jgi:phage-related protein